ncbi:MAG: ADP-ribosylglycohydrolase family protein [Anaerolineae bacterium]
MSIRKSIQDDYLERVYAGVLGKIIGVYLGRPFEGWTYERIMAELGEIDGYVHEKLGKLLIVTDDDISGTFSFLRAMPDYGNTLDLTPAQIGQTWLNYIIERRTVLWWGGLAQSTEHTAYLRLKHRIPAPRSGSIALNSKTVAEQIGAQIFIDGWGMIAPGDPELAADLARRAASVSHDGEAIYGAQVIAAMEAQAFVEPDINRLLDCGTSLIPKDSTIYRLIADLREWHAELPDWRLAREQVAAYYGYDKFPGNCHMVPNHALIIMALLYGEDNFQKALMIVNTSGWDTDCNSGNVGCLLGIKNGLAGIDAQKDWRTPVADRLYLSTADGGRAVTDAVREAIEIASVGRALRGLPPAAPKHGARFNFDLPGAVQGFQPDGGSLTLENVAGHSRDGSRSLALKYAGSGACASTPVFIPPEAVDMPGYELFASPTLYPGQTVRALLTADAQNASPATVQLYLSAYQPNGDLRTIEGAACTLAPGETGELVWTIPATGNAPIVKIGVQVSETASAGTVYLDWLTWDGSPDVTFSCLDGLYWSMPRPLWMRAWVNGIDQFDPWRSQALDLIQNEGRGLVSQGTRDWKDYSVSAPVYVYVAAAAGIGARVQGLRRYYGLLLCADGKARLVKALDGETTLAEIDFALEQDHAYDLRLDVSGTRLRGWIDGRQVFDVADTDRPLDGGAVALICEEGRMSAKTVSVKPLST